MSEEEIMQGINKTLSFMKEELKAEHSCFNIKELDALNGLLDLYQKEKEKNKEAKEMLDTTPKDLVHKVFEINRAKIVNANDYIHKDKIKEKIQRLEKRIDYLDKELAEAYIQREKLGTETELDANEQYIYNMEQEQSIRHTEKYAYLKLLEEGEDNDI